ncbi:cytochrome c [Pantoea sp. GL120224-02]|uniref:cytochrome c n=1 Tax=Pantoea sp. GL120224-02 TaxID=1378084 RepID=UPI000BD95A5D|nr:cytochrome c [Pantoea sp. GL120224-02]SNY64466.1 Cytochrome c, mono- and diheme variants [Pantoea sp. GL120224-02]
MRKHIRHLAAASLLLAGAVQAQDASPDLVKRGKYLATAGDCSACHRDPHSGKPFSGGYAIQSPMGMIYGSNITPSKTAGIGNYSLADFTAVMRKGKAPGNHYLYPAMPYTSFAGLSDEDIHALYSYLMLGVPADDHPAPETDLPFPFSFRPVMAMWNLLFLDSSAVPGSDAAAGSAERGEYLVRTLAHCSTCHTPRNGMMAEQGDRFLSGGKVGSWTAPNITPDAQAGIGDWSDAEIVTYLRTGALHGKAIAAGEMGTAVQNSFSKMQQSDLEAMAHYLKQVPAIGGADRKAPSVAPQPTPLSAIETGMKNEIADYVSGDAMSGAQLYNGACATCHASDGRGTHDAQRFYPSLVGSSAVLSDDPANLIMTIAEGVDRQTGNDHAFMPEFRTQFSQAELAKVADYVSTNFGNPQHAITPADVEQTLKGESGSWLVRYAHALSIIGGVVALLVIVMALILFLRRRK